jgi:hypothetical protein
MRRGGFLKVSPRDRTVIRPDRPAFASVDVSFAQGIKCLRTLAFALISYDMQCLIQMFGFFKTPTPVAVGATCTGTQTGPNRLPSLAGLE